MTTACRPGINWQPLDGDVLWLANGQDFHHEITVDDPWPVGTVSWLEFGAAPGHFADGVLSSDRLTFVYRAQAPAGDSVNVPDRTTYRFWVTVPNEALDPEVDNWKWIVGEVRRDDR